MTPVSSHLRAGAGPSSSSYPGSNPGKPSQHSSDAGHIGAQSATSGNSRKDSVTAVMRVDKGNMPVGDGTPKPNTLVFINELSNKDPDFISRYIFVKSLPDGSLAGSHQEGEMYAVTQQMKLYACFANSVPTYAEGIHLRFDDVNDALEASQVLQDRAFETYFIDPYEFAQVRGQDTSTMDEFEGQIRLSFCVQPLPGTDDENAIFDLDDSDLEEIKSLATGYLSSRYGEVRLCTIVEVNSNDYVYTLRMEFSSIDTANRAVQSINRMPVYHPNASRTWVMVSIRCEKWDGPRTAKSPNSTQPLTDEEDRLTGYQPNSAPPREHDAHNKVRRERIEDGSDVRSTIMLRNIPNKIDRMTLKGLFDEIAFGTFDFMYLRIDFKTGCNVGYAFINFCDITGMLATVELLEGRVWKGFRSTKAAEVSYATIQGREALVQKFRNSSVMQETPYCRPRVFLSHADAIASGLPRAVGAEQAFPRANNLSKLQRSMESARSVGLFPPQCVPIHDHRTRVSGFDRGTPRDLALTQAAAMARSSAVPAPVANLDDEQRRSVELWYYANVGQSSLGITPFEFIPLMHICYCIKHVLNSGQSSDGAQVRAANLDTPTRGRASEGAVRTGRVGRTGHQ